MTIPTPPGPGDPPGQPTGYGQPDRPAGAPPVPPYGQASSRPRNALGTVALVLGILAIFPGFYFIGLLLGLVAIAFGIVGRRRARRGEATNGGAALAGIVTGAIGFVLAAALTAGGVALFNSDSGRKYRDCLSAAQNRQEQRACTSQLGRDLTGRRG